MSETPIEPKPQESPGNNTISERFMYFYTGALAMDLIHKEGNEDGKT